MAIVSVERRVITLPNHRGSALAASLALHAGVAVMATALAAVTVRPPAPERGAGAKADESIAVPIVFVQSSNPTFGGGGGGGNRQSPPLRRAAGDGRDAATLRVAKSVSASGSTNDLERLPAVLLDARELASPGAPQIGLPSGGVPFGTSTGSGSGGGVGDGTGTGIGSGRGPGVGAGFGGGTGGGVYRAGGSVTPPKLLMQVVPTYAPNALRDRIQGSVVLDVVIEPDGAPSSVRVVRSLGPELDEQAIQAARQWRFEPGRLSGKPVAVAIRIVLDFRIW